MNVFFTAIMGVGTILMLILAPERYMSTLMSGAEKALLFSVKLFIIYAVWLSVIKVLEKSNTEKKLAKLLSPVTKRLFPKENDTAYSAISLNVSANLLGMGGAATPMGIKAMGAMQSKKNRVMLVVINSTSLQLIPTTILSLRASYGAVGDIVLPSLIVTAVTTALGILIVKTCVK